jgi:hypothetical protein
MKSGWGSRLCLASVAIVALCAGPLAGATPAVAADGVTVTAELGARGSVSANAPIPIRVTVTADRTVRGTVRAVTNAGPGMTNVERDLTVVAGSTKSFWMVVPWSPFFGSVNGVRVTLREDGERSTTVEAIRGAASTMVGVLPKLANDVSPPNNITMQADLGVARSAVLPLDLLELGPAAIATFATIAGSSADLAALTASARTTLLHWMNHGGRLLIDDDLNGQLPPEWTPKGSRGPAGEGEVWLTQGALGRGEWGRYVMPGVTDNEAGSRFGFQGDFGFNGNGQTALIRDAGLRLNRLGSVLVIVGIYVVLVGPVMFFVLRRAKRLPAGWLTIPALSLLATALVLVAGARTRQGSSAAHGSVYELSPAGAEAHVTGLVIARSPGERGLALPAGWTQSVSPFGFGFDGTPLTMRYTDRGATLSRPLGSGQAATLSAVGPSNAPTDQLSVTATSKANGEVTGTVRNTGSTELADVAVFAERKGLLIGPLAPGAEKPFAIDRATANFGAGPAAQVWQATGDPRFGGFAVATTAAPFGSDAPPAEPTAPPPEPQVADLALWSQFTSGRMTGRDRGSVRATGWRRNATAPVTTLNGAAITAGRIAVTVEGPIIPSGAITDIAVKREWIAGDTQPDGNGALSLTMRFTLPDNADTARAFDLTGAAGLDATIWDGTAWQAVTRTDGVAAVPAAAFGTGVILVRAKASLNGPGGFGNFSGLAIQEHV